MPARQRVGARQRLERRGASPARRSPRRPSATSRSSATLRRHSGPCGAPASASSASICAHRSRQVSARKRRACRRTWSARLAMRRRGRRRADADRVQRAEQLQRAVLGALGGGDARHRAEAEQHRLGQAAALEHVEPVGQQRRRPRRAVALPQRGGEQRRQHAGERAAPAEVALGARQRRPQQLLGQQHLAFPQVGQADDEVAPAAEVAERRAVLAARRLLLAQARQRRLAVEQRAERRAVGVHLQQQRIGQRRRPAPRGRAARRSGRGRRRRPPRRSGSARIRSAARRRRRAARGCAR